MRGLGVHVSIVGGYEAALERAMRLGCTAYQIFSRSPRSWAGPRYKDGGIVKERLERVSIKAVCIHAPYLVNLASPDPALRRRSVDTVCEDIELSRSMGAGFVVVHPGSGKSMKEKGFKAFVRSLEEIVDFMERSGGGVTLLVENTTGQGGLLGGSIRELVGFIECLGLPECLGICLDTCHLFSFGYDIGDVATLDSMCEVLERVGLYRVCVIHLNDSKGGLGSGIDRHEHIGLGEIGIERFEVFLNHPAFRCQPLILETPKKSDEDDLKNLEVVKGILGK